MIEFFSLENLAGLLTCFATLMIFSFLYRDNPFYKFAEHVFVGMATGYQAVLVWFQVIRPNLVEKLLVPEDKVRLSLLSDGGLDPQSYMDHVISFAERMHYAEWIYLLFLVLGLMMLFKVSDRLNWVSRWPLAYVIGAFAGIQVIQATQGSLIPQVHATMKDFTGQATIVELLDNSGLMPDGEFQLRAQQIDDYFSGMLFRDPQAQDSTVLVRERDRLVAGMRSAVDADLLHNQPRVSLAQMRVAGYALAQQGDVLESALCDTWGGRPLERSLLMLMHPEQDDVALGELEQNLRATDELRTTILAGVTQEQLSSVILAHWQSVLYSDMLRVRLESAEFRKALANRWQPTAGATAGELALAFCRPNGRPSLLEAYKSEGFPDAQQPDWQAMETNRIVDSLMTQVNSRPARLAEWRADQISDLRARIGDQHADLAKDFELRMAALDESLSGLSPEQALVIRNQARDTWLRSLLDEKAYFYQSLLTRAVQIYCNHDLTLPFSREQMKQLRQHPKETLAYSDNAISAKAMRWRMLVEILSNLLVVIGVCTGVFYFFFSKKHVGALGVASKVGIAFLMMSFGASFGYTVMGRISLAIGRFQDLLAYPKMAVFALLVLVVTLALWEKLRKKREPAGPGAR